MFNALLFLSKSFSLHTEKMDFTDFVEPWSFEFIPFHTFSIFVLAKIFHHTQKDGFYIPADMKLRLSGFCSTLSMTETPFKKGPL